MGSFRFFDLEGSRGGKNVSFKHDLLKKYQTIRWYSILFGLVHV